MCAVLPLLYTWASILVVDHVEFVLRFTGRHDLADTKIVLLVSQLQNLVEIVYPGILHTISRMFMQKYVKRKPLVASEVAILDAILPSLFFLCSALSASRSRWVALIRSS